MSNYKFRKLTPEETRAVKVKNIKVHGLPCTEEEFPEVLGGLLALFGDPDTVLEGGKLIQYWITAENGKDKVDIIISRDMTGKQPKVMNQVCFAVVDERKDRFSLIDELIELIYDASPSDN